MRRRKIIMVFITGLSGILTKWNYQAVNRKTSEPGRAPLVAGLTDLFSDPAAAIDIGKVYLRDWSGKELPACLLSGVGVSPSTPRYLSQTEFHRRRLRDFEEGKTLVIGGWIMARSELCACALLAYSQENQHT